jgi:outer membrane receptor protein involved in Fe transport
MQRSTSDGVIPVVPDATMGSAGLFAVERMRKGPFTAMAGLRADVHQVDGNDRPNRSFQALTWSAGGVWEAARGLAVSVNLGTAWRSPTLFELFASGPRLGEARYEIGRVDLEEERSLNLDAGVRWEGSGIRAHLAAFRNGFNRFLFIQPTEEFRDGYQVFRYEQADALLWGGEASLEVEPSPILLLEARADWVRGTNEDRDEPLPLMPPPRYDLRAELHGSWPSWADRAHVGDLTVRNATNEAYRDFLSRYKRFALDPGRDVVIRLRMGL